MIVVPPGWSTVNDLEILNYILLINMSHDIILIQINRKQSIKSTYSNISDQVDLILENSKRKKGKQNGSYDAIKLIYDGIWIIDVVQNSV